MSAIQLTEQQMRAVSASQIHPVSILTGKPGTGKTTTVKAIIDNFEGRGLKVLQCAPTGKAAKRMIESTGRPASTIHSALMPIFDAGHFDFRINENNPWEADLIIIDESSMLTTDLFRHVLRAISPRRTQLLLVGDTGQLPSVGAGAVLRDLIESGLIPHTELDIIHRNSGKIVEACASIHAGKLYAKETKIDLEAENKINLIHLDGSDPEKIRDAIVKIVSEKMPERGYCSTWGVQVISPLNNRGPLSCEAINEELRKKLNKNLNDPAQVFSEGDKVINTKNMKASGANDKREFFIVNGDMGTIKATNEKNMIVEFRDPEREVVIEKKNNNLLHAYCITCHRFQGSEAPVIIIPVHKSFSYFANRSWIYTAISRAKSLCVTVGEFSAIHDMIRNTRDVRRVTMLKERLIEQAGAFK